MAMVNFFRFYATFLKSLWSTDSWVKADLKSFKNPIIQYVNHSISLILILVFDDKYIVASGRK